MSGCRNILASCRKSHSCTVDAEIDAQKITGTAHHSWCISTLSYFDEKNNIKRREREGKRKPPLVSSGKRSDKCPQFSSHSRAPLQCNRGPHLHSPGERTQVSSGLAQTPDGGSCLQCSYLWLSHAARGLCCILTDCYTQWKCIIDSLMSPKAPRMGKRGKDWVFLPPATVAPFENLQQLCYWICWSKTKRTALEQQCEIMEGKILPQGPEIPFPSDRHTHCWGKSGCTPANKRLSAAQRLRHPKHSATACTQQISTEHHYCLMRL